MWFKHRELTLSERKAFATWLVDSYQLIHAGPTCGKSSLIKGLSDLVTIIDTDDILADVIGSSDFTSLHEDPRRDAYYRAVGVRVRAVLARGGVVVTNLWGGPFEAAVGRPADISIFRGSAEEIHHLMQGRSADAIPVPVLDGWIKDWMTWRLEAPMPTVLFPEGTFLSDFFFSLYSKNVTKESVSPDLGFTMDRVQLGDGFSSFTLRIRTESDAGFQVYSGTQFRLNKQAVDLAADHLRQFGPYVLSAFSNLLDADLSVGEEARVRRKDGTSTLTYPGSPSRGRTDLPLHTSTLSGSVSHDEV